MFRLLVLSAATALVSSAAFAADLPLPRAPAPSFEPAQSAPPPAEEPSHSGAYAGLEGGGGFNNTNADVNVIDPTLFFAPCFAVGCAPLSNEYSVDGAIAGGRIGFNVQTGRLVFGLEGDFDWSGMEGDDVQTNTVAPFVPVTLATSSDYSYIGTARARAGVAMGRVLIYGTGGLVFAKVEDSAAWGNPLVGPYYIGTEEDTLFGWTAGGGVDVLLTNHIVVGVQGLYFDLEDQEVSMANTVGAVPAGTAVDTNFEHRGFLAKGHISFKFGGGMGGM